MFLRKVYIDSESERRQCTENCYWWLLTRCPHRDSCMCNYNPPPSAAAMASGRPFSQKPKEINNQLCGCRWLLAAGCCCCCCGDCCCCGGSAGFPLCEACVATRASQQGWTSGCKHYSFLLVMVLGAAYSVRGLPGPHWIALRRVYLCAGFCGLLWLLMDCPQPAVLSITPLPEVSGLDKD